MTAGDVQDKWSAWLLKTRFAGDPARKKAFEDFLFPVRDRVLQNAQVGEGDVVLDVGAGDGLIAFGALSLVGESGRVLFSDVSQDLLEHSRGLAEQMGVTQKVDFILAPADDLAGVQDASVDVVTTRSVLIYVEDKAQAFHEFHRVLKPGCRLSIFEPINRFRHPEPPGFFFGYDLRPIQEIVDKVRRLYERLQPPSDPMLDFDERDLMELAKSVGFQEIHLDYQAGIKRPEPARWEHLFHSSGNPKIPTLQHALAEALTPAEAEHFVACLRPLVERGEGVRSEARAYLWARK